MTRFANLLAFGLCAGYWAYAIYLQQVTGLEPCPLCIFQRVVFAAMGFLFLVAALHGKKYKIYAFLQTLLAGVGCFLAIRHLYLQSLPADQVPACGPGLSYMLDTLPLTNVVRTVLTGSGECAKVDLILGLSIPWWTLISYIGLALWAWWIVRIRKPKGLTFLSR